MADETLLEDVSCEEEGGAIVSLRRKLRISGLSSHTYDVLLEALNDINVPQPGHTPANYPNLVLTKRIPRVMPRDPTKVEIELVYSSRANAKFNREEFQFRVSGGTALQQVEKHFDRYGNQLLLQHTYPADDPDYPDETKYQTGQIGFLKPMTTLIFEGVLRTAYPHYISANLTNRLNNYYWAGGAPYSWQVTDVKFDLHNTGNSDGVANSLDLFLPLWNFSFEFLYDPETHIPVAMFNDPREDRPPINLVANEGYIIVDAYNTYDFNQLFPV